jgi:predicted nucleic acid-binding protein
MPGKKKIYWDANVFLAWLKNEQQWGAAIMGGIEDTVRKVHNNEAVLFTSTMTQTEIFESRLNHAAKEKWEGVFKRKNVKMISVDQRIGALGSHIRDYYNRKKMQIASPDAIHLATAIIYKADEFHTLDGAGKKQRSTDLLKLGTKIAGRYNLLICKPEGPQLGLLTDVPTIKIEGSKDKVGTETNPMITSIAGSFSISQNRLLLGPAALPDNDKEE